MKDLSHRGMLANLKIRQWSGRKQDKKVTRQIEKDHNAKNAGRFNKILIDEDELREIQKVGSAARAYYYESTLPWGDNGDRLLSAKNIFIFLQAMRKFREEYENATETFIKKFPELKMLAKKRLNGMYDENDYPTVSVLSSKFLLKVETMPIADVDDFRVAMDPEEVEKLKVQIEDSIKERIYQATQDIWGRIQTAVNHMYEKLSDKDGKFHNTLVSNIEELIELLPRLNFTNDPSIDQVISDMKSLLVNPEVLRTDPTTRSKTTQDAKSILDKVSDYFG
jgi:hypothetical protein